MDRLLVLTLALEAALKEDNLTDAQSLFDARSIVIQQIEQLPLADPTQLNAVAEVDKRIEAAMVIKTQAIASELRKGAVGKAAQRAYSAQKRVA